MTNPYYLATIAYFALDYSLLPSYYYLIMKLIVGLGNLGDKYKDTRHNIGFESLDYLLKKLESLDESTWEDNKKTKSLIKKVMIKDTPALLAKPLTYMNNSGMAVSLLLDYFKIAPEDLIVIHDELDLPLGKLQIRFGGGTAGHNGVESLVEHLKTDKFLRIRMGVGKPIKLEGTKFDQKRHHSVEQYVLQRFEDNEYHEVRTMIKHIARELPLLITHGFENYMSKFHTK